MQPTKIVTNFNPLSDADFLTKARAILTAITGNPFFPSPMPSVATLSNAVDAFALALTAAQSREKNDVALKNEKRRLLKDLLMQLANWVTAAANGDSTALVSSGFDMGSTRPAVVLQKPTNIKLSDGSNDGELQVMVARVKGAKCYVHQCSTDPNSSNWQQEITTTRKHTFRRLASATRYWCRVAAVGTSQQMLYSDVVSRVVQ